MLAGNAASLLAPVAFVPILTLAFRTPKYDWASMKKIQRGDDSDLADAAHIDLEQVPGGQDRSLVEKTAEQAQLAKSAKVARISTVVLTLALLVLWPMPLYGTGYIFSKQFFRGWVIVAILWLACSGFCVGLFPLWEGRKTSARTLKFIFLDITGRGRQIVHHGRPAMTDGEDNSSHAEEKKAAIVPGVSTEC